MNKILFISMVIFAVAKISSSLKVGQKANEDKLCLDAYGATICPQDYLPICAKLNNQYLSGTNTCKFCSKYGNTEAVILQIGVPANRTFSCQPLKVGGRPFDDPECANYYRGGTYKTDYTTFCTKESYPICAKLANGTLVEGINKCVFCTRYGQVLATIVSLGRSCY